MKYKKLSEYRKKDIRLIIFLFFILVLGTAFSEKVEAQENASLNYVWNESCTAGGMKCQ